MKINFYASATLDISVEEIIKIIQETERMDAERFNRPVPTTESPVSESPASTSHAAESVATDEPWMGKMAKVNSRYSEQELKGIAYEEYIQPRKVIEESGNTIKLENDNNYWVPKNMFELVKE